MLCLTFHHHLPGSSSVPSCRGGELLTAIMIVCLYVVYMGQKQTQPACGSLNRLMQLCHPRSAAMVGHQLKTGQAWA